MIKIVTVVGARPQFIKAAVVSRALRAHATDMRDRLLWLRPNGRVAP